MFVVNLNFVILNNKNETIFLN